MASGLFGELYLRSTQPFLAEHVTAAEVRYLLEWLPRDGLILDVGCGHARHLSLLRASRPVIGIDLDAYSLRGLDASVVRGDFFELPFRDGAYAGAYAWYNTLFSFEDSKQVPLFRELARCVRPGGTLIVQGTWCQWAAAQAPAEFRTTLPDGSKLTERAAYDSVSGRDHIERELVTPEGRLMAGSFFIRYYALDVLEALLDEAGFTMSWVHGSIEGRPVSVTSPDLIVGAVKRG